MPATVDTSSMIRIGIACSTQWTAEPTSLPLIGTLIGTSISASVNRPPQVSQPQTHCLLPPSTRPACPPPADAEAVAGPRTAAPSTLRHGQPVAPAGDGGRCQLQAAVVGGRTFDNIPAGWGGSSLPVAASLGRQVGQGSRRWASTPLQAAQLQAGAPELLWVKRGDNDHLQVVRSDVPKKKAWAMWCPEGWPPAAEEVASLEVVLPRSGPRERAGLRRQSRPHSEREWHLGGSGGGSGGGGQTGSPPCSQW